jgi:hypothetical protein
MVNPSAPQISKALVSPQHARAVERTRHDVRAFFIIFMVGALIWMFTLSYASYRNGESFFTTLGTLGMFSAAGMMVGGLLGFLLPQTMLPVA